MAGRVRIPGGGLEYGVLTALWDGGSATAREIHERIGEPEGLVYTTIAKVLDRLYAKRLVSRVLRGKAFIDRARFPRDAVDRARVREVLGRLLGEAPRPAVAPLVDALEEIDPGLLDDLAREVARRRGHRGS